MTEVLFHINVAHWPDYGLRLMRKVWSLGAKPVVLGEAALLQEMAQYICVTEPEHFIPYAFAEESRAAQDASMLVLAAPEQLPLVSPNYTVLLQCCRHSAPPAGFERFAKVAEIVADEESARAMARERWKYYQHRGYPLQRHMVKANTSANFAAVIASAKVARARETSIEAH